MHQMHKMQQMQPSQQMQPLQPLQSMQPIQNNDRQINIFYYSRVSKLCLDLICMMENYGIFPSI